ncbi:hypothetical protein H8F24_05020 [Synechococcus sp. CBW1002]|uniref:hypothetical protein n=1 Tax=unclassified Synechococcus TaxID=2626047 RepID=UPI0018CCC8EA|nr:MULTISPECIES: hypothetical protein [unclassified Synechococcus]QPN60747.1 hypothetical protein H8F24_05020 [Synechococcus sp. CBW1002]QPN67551.1 hypothetical protein H8F26_05050 [Synechococcus sp. CBW1006]
MLQGDMDNAFNLPGAQILLTGVPSGGLSFFSLPSQRPEIMLQSAFLMMSHRHSAIALSELKAVNMTKSQERPGLELRLSLDCMGVARIELA